MDPDFLKLTKRITISSSKYGIEVEERVLELFDRITSNDDTLTSFSFNVFPFYLSHDETKVFASIMNQNTHLEQLDLVGLRSHLAVKELAEALKHNTTLKKITFGHGLMQHSDVIFHALVENQTLEHLQIIDAPMYKAQVDAMAHALRVNTTLHTLILKECQIKDNQIGRITDIIHDKCALKMLKISGFTNNGTNTAFVTVTLSR